MRSKRSRQWHARKVADALVANAAHRLRGVGRFWIDDSIPLGPWKVLPPGPASRTQGANGISTHALHVSPSHVLTMTPCTATLAKDCPLCKNTTKPSNSSRGNDGR